MDDDLIRRWTALWGSGIEQVWRHYAAAQETIRQQGRALVGQTPAEAVYTEGPLRLMHYRPLVDASLPVPVLCVPSLINRYYIMDLTPERSMVRYLLSQGLDVYMLDWGTATSADCQCTLDDYITGRLRRCVEQVRHAADGQPVALLGYCMGGMMSAVYAVLFPGDVAALVNLAGPINYHDDGIYSVWTRPDWLNVDLLVDTLGNIPAELLNLTFHLVHPTDEIMQAMNYWERRDDEAFMRGFAAMQFWTHDPTPFPGEAFRQYIKDLYQENRLLRDEFVADGRPIDLRRMTAPTLTIAARRDHIAPWKSVTVLHDLIASADKETIVLESGHIGMVIGSSAHAQLWPQLSAWLVRRATASP